MSVIEMNSGEVRARGAVLEPVRIRAAVRELNRLREERLSGQVPPERWDSHRSIWAADIVRRFASFAQRWPSERG